MIPVVGLKGRFGVGMVTTQKLQIFKLFLLVLLFCDSFKGELTGQVFSWNHCQKQRHVVPALAS